MWLDYYQRVAGSLVGGLLQQVGQSPTRLDEIIFHKKGGHFYLKFKGQAYSCECDIEFLRRLTPAFGVQVFLGFDTMWRVYPRNGSVPEKKNSQMDLGL